MVFEALEAIANTDQSGAFRTLSKFHVKYGYSHSVRTLKGNWTHKTTTNSWQHKFSTSIASVLGDRHP